MGPYPPQVTLALPTSANQRLTSGIEVSTPYGAVSTQYNSIFHFSSPECRSFRDMEGCLNRRRDKVLPGLLSLYAFPSISDRPVGLGFPRRVGRCRPGRTRFLFLRCRRCTDMERCSTEDETQSSAVRRDWGGSNGDRTLSSRGCACSTRPSQSATGPWYWGFHTVWGGVDPGELDFCPRSAGVVEIWRDV